MIGLHRKPAGIEKQREHYNGFPTSTVIFLLFCFVVLYCEDSKRRKEERKEGLRERRKGLTGKNKERKE